MPLALKTPSWNISVPAKIPLGTNPATLQVTPPAGLRIVFQLSPKSLCDEPSMHDCPAACSPWRTRYCVPDGLRLAGNNT